MTDGQLTKARLAAVAAGMATLVLFHGTASPAPRSAGARLAIEAGNAGIRIALTSPSVDITLSVKP